MMLSYRPDFDPLWAGRCQITHIKVNRLEGPQVTHMIEAIAVPKYSRAKRLVKS
jgi:hypothetical protein